MSRPARKGSAILARYRAITRDVYGAHRGFPRALSIGLMWVLAFIIAFTQYTGHSRLFYGPRETAVALLLTALIMCLAYQGLKLLFYGMNRLRVPAVSASRARMSAPLFWGVLSGALLYLLLYFIADYPGGISVDNVEQWYEATTMALQDWHPAFHTLLIALLSWVHGSYPFVILVQILVFSAGIAYLTCVLSSWGLRWPWLALMLALVVLNQNTVSLLQFAYKDTAFSLAVLFLAALSINIVLSRGAWLGRRRNLVAVAAALALVTLLRHNGLLISLPLAALLLILYAPHRRGVLIAAVACAACVFLVRVPLYRALSVRSYPEQTYVESVGLPMTILGDIRMQNPSALDEETHAFLLRIAPEESWQQYHALHAYNPIKWHSDAFSVIPTVAPADLLSMTLRAIRSDPVHAFAAFTGLTDMVWRTDRAEGGASVWIADDIQADVEAMTAADRALGLHDAASLQTLQAACRRITQGLRSILLRIPLFHWLTTSLGVQILLLLLFGMFSVLYRRGMPALLLILPPMAYVVATMLLLAGDDYRLFSFTLVINIPMALALWARQKS